MNACGGTSVRNVHVQAGKHVSACARTCVGRLWGRGENIWWSEAASGWVCGAAWRWQSFAAARARSYRPNWFLAPSGAAEANPYPLRTNRLLRLTPPCSAMWRWARLLRSSAMQVSQVLFAARCVSSRFLRTGANVAVARLHSFNAGRTHAVQTHSLEMPTGKEQTHANAHEATTTTRHLQTAFKSS